MICPQTRSRNEHAALAIDATGQARFVCDSILLRTLWDVPTEAVDTESGSVNVLRNLVWAGLRHRELHWLSLM